MLGEPPPSAALFGDIQNGIEDLKVGESHIAALNREAMGDLLVLGFADFNPRILPGYVLADLDKTKHQAGLASLSNLESRSVDVHFSIVGLIGSLEKIPVSVTTHVRTVTGKI
jgi:hypothetical protein